MTPTEHAKAIEDAARKVTQASIDYMVDSGLAYKLGRAEAALQSAIRAGVGAAPPKDSAEFALAALVAAGHVSQSKVDEARALMPEGGHVPKAAPEGWQLVPVEPIHAMLAAAAITRAEYSAMLAAAPKP